MVLPASSMAGQKLGTAPGRGQAPSGPQGQSHGTGLQDRCFSVTTCLRIPWLEGGTLKKNAERGGGLQSKLIMIPVLEVK